MISSQKHKYNTAGTCGLRLSDCKRGHFYYNHGLFEDNGKTSTPIRGLESNNQTLKHTASVEAFDDIIPDQGDNLNIEEASRPEEGGFNFTL
jgi:hypothetical protein